MREFESARLLQIAMPMGGIGAGCVSLAGNGAWVDWAIRNRPATSGLADTWSFVDAAWAVIHIRGEKPTTRLLEGPLAVEKIYDQGLQANGYRHGMYEGLPRFETAKFKAAYPFGTVELSHPQIPLDVSITGFNPFIPLDDKNSGLPCAIAEYRFENRSTKPVEFEFSFHVTNLAIGHTAHFGSLNDAIPGFGVRFANRDKPNTETFGTAAFGVVGHTPKIKAMWFRGGWFDHVAALWREVSTGTFKENNPGPETQRHGMNGGSILLPCTLEPGQSISYPIVLAWHFPNVHMKMGGVDHPPAPGNTPTPPAPYDDSPPAWRPFYAGQWKDAADVALYVRDHYASLRSRTAAFCDALFSSTLPASVIDAVSSNLAILKSPTVLRLEDGQVWAWEGLFTTHGSCHGSCTHVWNYAQALPHLFPALERTLREQELVHSMDDRGHVQFRSALPTGPAPHNFHAAADGQLGGILKVFREWQISGDRAWLARMYPLAKRSLDYCIRTWDPQRNGTLSEPHHNTYDIEFWGADGMCTSFYVAALSAFALMATEMGHDQDATTYRALAEKGAKALDAELFNGEYFQQKVEYRSLVDQSFVKLIEGGESTDPETLELLRAEGPKYQYGTGCLSDGVIGAWMARLYGVQTPQTQANIRKTLAAIFKHNFKTDLSDHACTQRPGYAIGHEAGLVVCTWPRGEKPTLPFVYCDEVFTGIEYQVASHLILEGMVDEGLAIVQAVRNRYEGHVRNPFNEYECGSYYARALASYALLQSLSGFRYSAASQTLWFGPRLPARPFKTFFSAATGFGTIELNNDRLTIHIVEGNLTVARLILTTDGHEKQVEAGGIAAPGRPLVIDL